MAGRVTRPQSLPQCLLPSFSHMPSRWKSQYTHVSWWQQLHPKQHPALKTLKKQSGSGGLCWCQGPSTCPQPVCKHTSQDCCRMWNTNAHGTRTPTAVIYEVNAQMALKATNCCSRNH